MSAWTVTALEPARRDDAPRLAADVAALVESGTAARRGAPVRIGWHVRDAESVVLTARYTHRGIAGFAIMRYGDEPRT